MAERLQHELSGAEAAVLLAATQEAGAKPAALGAALVGGAPAAMGATAGARWSARFTTPQTAACTVEVPQAPEAARERARAVIERSGIVLEDPNAAGDGSLWGLVGFGRQRIPFILVRIDIEASGSGGAHLRMLATTREGLIKRNLAARAAEAMAASITGPAP